MKFGSEGENRVKGFDPQKTLLNPDMTGISKDDWNRKVKRFLKNEDITRQVATAVALQITEPDSNIYIIINPKVYKVLGDKLIKRFGKLLDLEEPSDLFVKYTDFNTIASVYRKSLKKEIDKHEDKFDKLKYDDEVAMRDKSYKLSNLNAKLDDLEDEYNSPDKVEARKYFLKEAKPSKDTRKKMEKFLDTYKKNYTVNSGYDD
jgi:hypothetical protein